MKRFRLFLLVVLSTGVGNVVSNHALAQSQTPIPDGRAAMYPANPTSFDDVKILFINRACAGFSDYTGNPYRVSMNQGNIRVTLGELSNGAGFNPCPPSPSEEVLIGRLPAGDYTLTIVEPTARGNTQPGRVSVANFPFTITDGRAQKSAPYVRSDYSGHWWDPNDSGWGLFIWQDARDNLLAAWFTYGTDGKPVWYVFQPTWATATATGVTSLVQTQRPPGPTSPPPNPTSTASVGNVKLDFTPFGAIDRGTLTYTIGNGPTLTRDIQRFRP